MYRTLAKAALTIAPAPLPADERARLTQLLNEAFDLDCVVSAMMNTVYSVYQQQKEIEGLDGPAWQLWHRMYRISQRGHRRYARRRAAMDIFEANSKALS
jgi:hypothetical protein